MDGELGEGGGRNGRGAQDGLLRPPAGEPGQRQEDGAHARWEIGRARKTAKCMGGWEYELRPAGGGMGMGEWMRKKDLPGQVSASQLAEAREKRRGPESLRARLEEGGSGRGTGSSVGRWQVALTGDPGKAETVRAVEKLVETWWMHVQEAGGGAGWNVPDRPRMARPGAVGGWEGHDSAVARSYYRGGRETVTGKAKDGKERSVERSRMGLDADKAWERGLPQELTVSIDQVQRAVEAVEAGEVDMLHHPFPEHEPHTRVQYEIVLHYTANGQGRVWAGDRRQREAAALEEAEKRVRALPDEADAGQVEEALKAAWGKAVERYVREHAEAEGWTETETATAVRMAQRESEGTRPGGGEGRGVP